MNQTISIGKQDFVSLRENHYFYIDKTDFIRQWWENADDITLITRPRRFGKTLNMNMLNCFFSRQYENRGDLFKGLSIWTDQRYQRLQGSYPVIFISFADVKQNNYKDAIQKIKNIIVDAYRQHRYLNEEDCFTENEKQQMLEITEKMDDVTAQDALKNLSSYLNLLYGKKVLIFLDEYDTPMQEAYINGYWDEFTGFMRGLFNATFKTNPYLERAVMTGITRVSKESVFSDLNNLTVITTTSDQYADCFGFTEEEVFKSLDQFGMSDKKQIVKQWYDGFSFGPFKDIYNPWSITNYLKEKKLRPYWASTSSNGLISKLLQSASANMKTQLEELLNGKQIIVNFDEQIIFGQLEQDENAVWSLLVASGYLKVEEIEYKGMTLEPWYHLAITNLETISMFSNMFKGWFATASANYNEFIKAMLGGNVKAMNLYMNDIALATFSSFDVGKHFSQRSQPERFYHGFVLGLLVEVRDLYEIRSNRESGYGRYDVMLIPKTKKNDGIILEFKVKEAEEKTLEETVQTALAQIEDKEYDTELLELGVSKEHIRHYGFAFEGKKVLIGQK
ncbi:MAG: ATP-binding protein [Anaerostipes hadrus]|nr:AAA family ATPase [uncultured Anaerostipes sp.]MCI6008799.1 ATP-binding protein [Anaerostipes hadrus]